MTLALALDLSPVIPRPYLTPAELDEIAYQLDQLDAPSRPQRKEPTTNPSPEQLSLAPIAYEPRGALLCALARSPLDSERATAHEIVRRSLELHGSTIPAAAALSVSERWIQTLIKRNPALCQGLSLRKQGRPPTPPETHHDDESRMDARRNDR